MATQEFKGRGQTDSITAFLGAGALLVVGRRPGDPGLPHQPDSSPARRRLRADDPAGRPRRAWRASSCSITRSGRRRSAASSTDRSATPSTRRRARFCSCRCRPHVKMQAKPFVDVTVDRLAKGVGALFLLVLIAPWGFGLTWQQLSWASLALIGLWLVMAVRAKREYVASFRRSLEQQNVQPAEIRLDTADLSTIETLVGELSHPDPRRVLYAVDLLESLDKRHLVTPLLLHHESPEVRARVLALAERAGVDHGGALAAVDSAVAQGQRRQRAAGRGSGARVDSARGSRRSDARLPARSRADVSQSRPPARWRKAQTRPIAPLPRTRSARSPAIRASRRCRSGSKWPRASAR